MSSPGETPKGASDPHWKIKLVVEAFGRGIGPAAIAGAIAFLGYHGNQSIQSTNNQLQRIAEETRKANVVIEITSRQKALDVDIGMRLLENLLGDLLRPNAADAQRVVLQQRILLLKLVALNLWDVPLHLKPLYESVDRQLTDESLREELRDAAKGVARKQAFRLASSGGFDISSAVLEVGEEKEFAEIALGAGQLNIVLHEVKEDNALISLIFAEEFGRTEFGPFNVSYFDAPLTDNAKHSSVRVAAILLSTSPSEGKAEFRVLVFDDDLATDRIDIQELTRELKSRGTAAGSPPSK